MCLLIYPFKFDWGKAFGDFSDAFLASLFRFLALSYPKSRTIPSRHAAPQL